MRRKRWVKCAPERNRRGQLCGLCDGTDEHEHQRVACSRCGRAGLQENWPFGCCGRSRSADELGEAFDAGAAWATAGHRDLKQTHPSKEEWLSKKGYDAWQAKRDQVQRLQIDLDRTRERLRELEDILEVPEEDRLWRTNA